MLDWTAARVWPTADANAAAVAGRELRLAASHTLSATVSSDNSESPG
jgi:hypothetical protein